MGWRALAGSGRLTSHRVCGATTGASAPSHRGDVGCCHIGHINSLQLACRLLRRCVPATGTVRLLCAGLACGNARPVSSRPCCGLAHATCCAATQGRGVHALAVSERDGGQAGEEHGGGWGGALQHSMGALPQSGARRCSTAWVGCRRARCSHRPAGQFPGGGAHRYQHCRRRRKQWGVQARDALVPLGHGVDGQCW